MINYFLQKKSIVLNRKNIPKYILKDITWENYTYIFTNIKIALLNKFKKYIFDNNKFIEYFYLLVINEIYLVDK